MPKKPKPLPQIRELEPLPSARKPEQPLSKEELDALVPGSALEGEEYDEKEEAETPNSQNIPLTTANALIKKSVTKEPNHS